MSMHVNMCIHVHVWHVGRNLIKGFLKGIAYPCSSFPPNNIILYFPVCWRWTLINFCLYVLRAYSEKGMFTLKWWFIKVTRLGHEERVSALFAAVMASYWCSSAACLITFSQKLIVRNHSNRPLWYSLAVWGTALNVHSVLPYFLDLLGNQTSTWL